MNSLTASELTILLLRLGVVATLYLFIGWVALVVARDVLRGSSGRLGGSARMAEDLDLVVAVAPEGPVQRGQRFPLGGGATVGRDAMNSIVLLDTYVSAHHARFEWRNGRLWLEDLNSTNGTRLNGRLIRRPTPVVAGDLIEIGQFGFQVVSGSAG